MLARSTIASLAAPALLLAAVAPPALAAELNTSLLLQPAPPTAATTAAAPTPPSPAVAPAPKAFGQVGHFALDFGLMAAHDFDRDQDYGLYLTPAFWVAQDLQLLTEFGFWYFNQEGPDTGGVSFTLAGRWHFHHADDYRWSVFADLGVGVLGAFDDTPNGGSSFNLLPRAGLGFQTLINDQGWRLMTGLRWHHISNARITGRDENPSRNSLLLFAGLSVPF